MLRSLIAVTVIMTILAGCANSDVRIRPENVSVVFARNAEKSKGPTDVGEKFTLDGKVVAFMTFTWADLTINGSRQKVETRWYAGDKLVKQSEVRFTLTRSPWYVWTNIFPAALGLGRARFEAYSNGELLVSKSFDVVEK